MSTAVQWLKLEYPKRMEFEVANVAPQSEDGLVTAYRVEFATGGFVIVSANPDDRPIIAYSNFSSLTGADGVIERYINQTILAGIRDNGWFTGILEHGTLTDGKHDGSSTNIVVDPMIQSKWGQSGGNNPNFTYNNMTPYVTNSVRAPVGCTAVALGQVLKFYNYPKVGQLSNKYCSTGSSIYNCWDGEVVETRFDTKYAWDQMPLSLNSRSPRESVDAVAKLLLDVGRSMSIVYGEHGSNVKLEKLFGDFKKHFRLPNVQMVKRTGYSEEAWSQLIKDELLNHRPVVFSGYDSGADAGHAYVLDGLKMNAEVPYVHVNWGWGGSANGWYDMTTLVIDGKYSFTEDLIALINFTPNTVDEQGQCNGPGGLRCKEELTCSADPQMSNVVDEFTSDEFGTCMAEGTEPEEPPAALEDVEESFTATVSKNEWVYFGPFESLGDLQAKMAGNGDADLYVRKGDRPSSRVYDCRPYKSTSEEVCSIQGGATYYVALNGWADTSEVTLTVAYKRPQTSP